MTIAVDLGRKATKTTTKQQMHWLIYKYQNLFAGLYTLYDQ